jgi:isoamylase
VEGPTDDPEINRLRERQLRNFLGTLLLSQGTPMLLAGDEFGRTQNGNNNAYCQDREISWLNWNITDKGKSLIQFVKKLTNVRHKYPILRRNRVLTGHYVEEVGVKDVTWINANGSEMTAEQWQDCRMACFGMLLDRRAQASGIRKSSKDATLLLVLNGHGDLVEFMLSECYGGMQWLLLVDTNIADSSPGQSELTHVSSKMLVVFYQAHVPGWLQHRQVRTGNVVAHAATRLWFAHGIAVPGN